MGGYALACTGLATVGPRLIQPPKPPPLGDDIGLAGIGPAVTPVVAHPLPTDPGGVSNRRRDADPPGTRPSRVEHGARAWRRNAPPDSSEKAASPPTVPSPPPAGVATYAAPPPVPPPVATSPPPPPDPGGGGGPPEFGFEH
jgi:hypothetical protein